MDLDELLRTSDFVCICCDLNPETRHLLDTSKLALMKESSFLINMARGSIVDQRALTDALREGKIKGAVDEIEEIVRIPHLAGVLIGPNDLAAALGLIFQKQHPRVLAAIDKVKAAARQAGLPLGMAGLSDPESAVQWLQSGFQFATLGNINGMLMRASRDFVASVREGIAGPR